jgi:hypothetical protein
MVWRAQPSPTHLVFLALPVLAIAAAGWLWVLLTERISAVVFDGGVFLLGVGLCLALALAGTSAYLALCALGMRYTLGPDHLTISCGWVQHVIPYESVRAVHMPGFGAPPPAIHRKGWSGLLPGYVVGESRDRRLGRVISVATVPAASQVLVVTTGVTFGISPRNPSDFAARLEERQEDAGIEGDLDARVYTRFVGPAAWASTLWADRPARLLLLAGPALNALLFGYLSLIYGYLPERLPLHWNSQGQVDRIGDPVELLRLPVFALTVWVFNSLLGWRVLRKERAVTILLLAGAVAVQIAFAAGAVSIVSRAS